MTRKRFQIGASIVAALISGFFSLVGASFSGSSDFFVYKGKGVPVFLFVLWGLFWGWVVAWFVSGKIYDRISLRLGFILGVGYTVIAGIVIGAGNDLIMFQSLFPSGAIVGLVLGIILGLVLSFIAWAAHKKTK